MNVHIREALRTIAGSALRYVTINPVAGITNSYYYPGAPTQNLQDSVDPIEDTRDAGSPFKGLHISTECILTIMDVDNNPVTLSLTPGCWPYGGIGISKLDSSDTDIVLLY